MLIGRVVDDIVATERAHADLAEQAPGGAYAVTPETDLIARADAAPSSFLRTARSLGLSGPPDWSENLDNYLYGDGDRPEG